MMDKFLIAGYTIQDAMLAAGIVIGIIISVSILKRMFKKEKVNPYMQLATCKDCGWQGQVSRHAGRCPGCNQPLGDRMVNRPRRNEGPGVDSTSP